MGGERDGHYHHPPAQTAAPASSRMGLRSAAAGGEIVEVQGGHIVRSTGRKDRHSKVCTAKGPRDRRVRLSAHTAIQFYDVQDRLGYDRPSKAVDWLIKKAKAAIDELAELPAWHPTAIPASAANKPDDSDEPEQQDDNTGKKPATGDDDPSSIHSSFEQRYLGPPAPGMDSDAVIADTIKSFFPMVAATSSPSIPFRSYPPELLSRTTSGQAQDLRLSLHSFPEPMLHPNEQSLFSTAAMSFDGGASSSWSEHHHDMTRYWPGTSAGGPGYIFGSGLPPVMTTPAYQGQNQAQLFPQRGPLQSSNSPQVRAWPDSAAIPDHQSPAVGSVLGFASGSFSGFRVPARFQGEEDHDPVGGHKPPAGSSAPRH